MDDQTGSRERIDYIEMPVREIEPMRAFYGQAFGWTFKDYGAEYCEFQDGRLTGGFAKSHAVTPKGGPLVILFSPNLEETLARVEQAGGSISQPIFSFPGGRRFHFVDPEGYELGVWSDR